MCVATSEVDAARSPRTVQDHWTGSEGKVLLTVSEAPLSKSEPSSMIPHRIMGMSGTQNLDSTSWLRQERSSKG